MSLHERVVEGSWGRTEPYGVSKQSRWNVGWVKMPLRRRRTDNEPEDDRYEEQSTLFDRIVGESYPNRPWWSMPFAPLEPYQLSPAKNSTSKTKIAPPDFGEKPMNNPLPGNLNPRARRRGLGPESGRRKLRKAGGDLALGPRRGPRLAS